jgi:hypothetical protein
LSDPLKHQLKHFTDDLCVFVTLGDSFPYTDYVVRESPRLWQTSESMYCPLLYGHLIVETELDLGDHSEWIRVERDPALCELHNRDVDILCEWSNFRKKFYVFLPLILIYFQFLFKFVLA